MADTTKVTRVEINRLTKGDERMTRFLESLFKTVNEETPDSMSAVEALVFNALIEAGNSSSAVNQLASLVDTWVNALSITPPDQQAQRELNESGRLSALEQRVNELEQEIHSLQQGISL